MYSSIFFQSKNSILFFILLTNLIIPFSFDVFFVAQENMAASLNLSSIDIGKIQAMWSLGLCIGQFLLGPIIDQYGRKNVFIFGMAMVCLSSILCLNLTFISNIFGYREITILVFMRLLQGIGLSAQMLCSRAIINDLFPDNKEKSKKFASLITSLLIFAVIAPLVAGQMLSIWNWSSLFVLLALIAFIFTIILFDFPETLNSKEKVQVSYFDYLAICYNKKYIGYMLIGSLVFIWIFATLFSLPIIIIRIFKFTPQSYSIFTSLMMISGICGAALNQKLLNKYSIDQLIIFGCSFMSIIGLMLTLLSILSIENMYIPMFSSWTGLWINVLIIYILVFVANIFTAFMTANCITGAINCFQNKPGIAASMLGIAQFGISSITFPIVGIISVYTNIIIAMALLHTISMLASVLIYLAMIRNEK